MPYKAYTLDYFYGFSLTVFAYTFEKNENKTSFSDAPVRNSKFSGDIDAFQYFAG